MEEHVKIVSSLIQKRTGKTKNVLGTDLKIDNKSECTIAFHCKIITIVIQDNKLTFLDANWLGKVCFVEQFK